MDAQPPSESPTNQPTGSQPLNIPIQSASSDMSAAVTTPAAADLVQGQPLVISPSQPVSIPVSEAAPAPLASDSSSQAGFSTWPPLDTVTDPAVPVAVAEVAAQPIASPTVTPSADPTTTNSGAVVPAVVPITTVEATTPDVPTAPATQPLTANSWAAAMQPTQPAPVNPAMPATPTVAQPFANDYAPQPTTAAVGAGQAPTQLKSRHSLKPAVVILAAVILLGGSSAAAYYGVVAPNKPENILKAGLANTLQAQQITASGSLSGAASSAAYKLNFTVAADSAAKDADIKLDFTISGANVSVEGRLVDGNVYIRAGDLSTITALLSAADPGFASLAAPLNSQLSNQWISIDSTLLKQAGASCVLNTSWSLTKADINLLNQAYGKAPFATIKSTSVETVNGKSAEKIVLSVDDDKSVAFTKNLSGLSLVKSLQKCAGNTTALSSVTATGDHKQTSLTVWVDKGSKRIVKLGSESTSLDANSSVTGSGTITLSYDKVSVSAPTGAKSLIQVLTSLQAAGLGDLTSGLGTSASSTSSSSQTSSVDAESRNSQRQADLASIQTQLEAFFSENGYYPSLSDMNSSVWLSKNMKSLDQAALIDPSGSSKALKSTPQKGYFSYQVTDSAGASCEADDTTCAKYTLTATYEGNVSGSTTFVKTNLD